MAAAFVLLLTGGRQAIGGPANKALELDAGTVITNVLNAWRRADARAIAALYEADGDFVSPAGAHAVGRGAIEAFYTTAFQAGYAGSRATASVVHVRRLSATLALVDGSWTIDPTPASKITEPESGLFVAVLHRHDSRWWIVALREQTSAQALRELESSQVNDRR